MNYSVELIGVLAGILSCLTFIPQIRKTLKSKSVNDISFCTYLIVLISELGWMFYGIIIGSFSIILATFIACMSAVYILYLKLKYDDRSVLIWSILINAEE